MQDKFSIDDVVISSRIRLARNFKDIPFPALQNDERGFFVMKNIFSSVSKIDDFKIFPMEKLSKNTKGVLFEKHLISSKLIENSLFGAVILNSNESISLMINEEDHIREQSILKGFALSEAYNKINKIDDEIIKNNNIAFDDKLGFLTACPSNLGTGLRASVMVFLPALSLKNKIPNVLEAVKKLGQTVRGMYGEGSGGLGFIYQISNQFTLGKSEVEIIKEVEDSVYSICSEEIKERLDLLNNAQESLIQVCKNALDVLVNSKSISIEEFMKNLGLVKLGISLEILNIKDQSVFNDLMQIVQPCSLQELSGKTFVNGEVDCFRADYLRKILKNVIHF